jgi:preprotein translocase subunit SecB
MKQPIKPEHHSVLRFDRVWVREACFTDYPDQQECPPKERLSNAKLGLDVKVNLLKASDRALVTLRVVVTPTGTPPLFKQLSAAVEGEFSVAPGSAEGSLERFASLQAPVLLLPYVRQVVTNLTAESRIGPFIVPPLNMTSIIETLRQEVIPAKSESKP